MARSNRLTVADGWYHITARAHGRMFLLKDPQFKSRIVNWIYGIADFSGIKVGAWTLMDNHIHLLVHVPPVPERYYHPSVGTVPANPSVGTVPADVGTVPPSWAFGMRPAECRAPRWTPENGNISITPAGDSPSRAAFVRSLSDGVPLVVLPRPKPGFTLSDEEMLARLARLYSGYSNGATAYERKWQHLRLSGQDDLVEGEKERLCLRMYNVSQFAKTLFQRITETYNRETGHTGHFWEGRFHSVLVDPSVADRIAVAGYIALNPVRAKITKSAGDYAWSSYALACNGDSPLACRCRADFEKSLGCPWNEVEARLQGYFADNLPAELEGQVDCFSYEEVSSDGAVRRVPLRITQAVHARQRAFTHGTVFTHDPAFAKSVREGLPVQFPVAGDWAAERLMKFEWKAPRAA